MRIPLASVSSRFFLLIGMLAGLLLAPPTFAKDKAWTVLDNCTLDTEEYFDGDSFTVIHEGRRRTLRLLFVDCAETDDRIKERIKEQSDYFGIRESQVIRYGEMAKKFTEDLLQGKEFTVYTQWYRAEGQSKRVRYYALIKVGSKYLHEELVKAGHARVHGNTSNMPDGTQRFEHRDILEELETKAKRSRKGAWGR